MLKMLIIHVDILFQVFSKVGMVKSCTISKKKNKAGIAQEITKTK